MPFDANDGAVSVYSEEGAKRERTTIVAVSAVAATVNMGLGVIKVMVGLYTSSLSILTDGVNNFGDVLSNAGAAVGFGVENKPPSRRLPGGLGRSEYVVTLLMAIIIIGVGGGFAYSALDRVFFHPVITFSWVQFGVIAATIAVKIALAAVFRVFYKKFGSPVLKAQTLDSVMDACITTFALLGLFLSRYISFPVDAFIGLAISVVMIASGLKIAFSACYKLMGGADLKRENGLKKLSLSQKGVTDVRVRVYDFGTKYAEATVELVYENDLRQEDKTAAEYRIARTARKKGISVTFVRSAEEQEK